MQTLVVEDDFSTRLLLSELLAPYGPVHQATNGKEAIEAFQAAVQSRARYDLVCLDIMLPKMNGQTVLLNIRNMETQANEKNPTKIVMMTVLRNAKHVIDAFKGQCDGYLVKPLDQSRLIAVLKELNLIQA